MGKRKVTEIFGFVVIPIEEVPLTRLVGKIEARKPIVYPPADQRGSKYAGILRALSNNPGRAVKVVRKDSIPLADLTNKERRRIQSGLITISKNWLEKPPHTS